MKIFRPKILIIVLSIIFCFYFPQTVMASQGCCTNSDAPDCFDVPPGQDGTTYCRQAAVALAKPYVYNLSDCKQISFCPQYLKTETKTEPQKKIVKPTLQIEIPGFGGFKEPIKTEKGMAYSWIGDYTIAIYKWSVSVIAILAVVMIMIAGFQWVLSRGNAPAISNAKARISGAFMGLIIILSISLFLGFINPNLTILRPLALYTVKQEPLEGSPPSSVGLDFDPVPGGVCGVKNAAGDDLFSIARYYVKQQICYGPCHCAYFVSRVLADTSCPKNTILTVSADQLRLNLLKSGWQEYVIAATPERPKANDILFWGKPDWNIIHTAISTGGKGCFQSSPKGLKSIAPYCPEKNKDTQGTEICQACEKNLSQGPSSANYASSDCVSNQAIWQVDNCVGKDYGGIYSFLRKK